MEKKPGFSVPAIDMMLGRCRGPSKRLRQPTRLEHRLTGKPAERAKAIRCMTRQPREKQEGRAANRKPSPPLRWQLFGVKFIRTDQAFTPFSRRMTSRHRRDRLMIRRYG